jgi:pimeloyl-ACP methyl ester carboxylesterase
MITATAGRAATSPAQFAGDWAGALEVGMTLRIVVHLANTAGVWSGAMESPDQGPGSIPFSAVTVDGSKLHLEVKSINGSYDGTLDAKTQTITGTWSQNGNMLPLNLAHGDVNAIKPSNRPQEPKPPFPYQSEDVTIPGPGGNTLAGTLTLPKGSGPFPAVVLITGSGAQDRNEALMGHKPFLVLSDYLTRNGIAVLRCDDRGFGKSTGNPNGTTEDFARDTEAETAYLKTRKEVDARKIGLVGHSEGGVIAPIVAARSKDVAFIVMMAGVGVSPQDLLVKQAADIMRVNGLPETAIQLNNAAQRRTFQIATSSADSTLMRQQLDAVADSLIAQLSALDPSKKEMVTQQVRGGIAMTMTPWFRYFLTLKPDQTLRHVKQPVLAINGSLDLQVNSKDNLPAIEKALKAGGNKDVTATELPGLNHLFQTAKTGSLMEYATIEETMSPVAMKTISDWIVARTSPKK